MAGRGSNTSLRDRFPWVRDRFCGFVVLDSVETSADKPERKKGATTTVTPLKSCPVKHGGLGGMGM
jgi:hypothetical protein